MKVERRLPFGFRGDWGTVYKRYTGECTINTKNNQITYEKNNYVDIGVAVQFKAVEDITRGVEQALKGLMTTSTTITVETTDSYYCDKKKEYICTVDIGDIVQVLGSLWIVTSLKENTRYTPKKLSFYYLELKGISGAV